jgi:predicted patatin/cPLA2 family phospholipase
MNQTSRDEVLEGSVVPCIPPGVHPVIDAIRQRLDENSRPRERTDGHVIALAVEGGGMRGVLSAGMTLALESLGILPAVDRVYGSSAGAMMGAYFISGQSALAPSIYEQDLTTRTFINLGRFLTRRPVMNLDYLVDDVIGDIKPLDYHAVLNSPIELHVLVTAIARGASVDLSGFREVAALREALRAAARLPGIGGPPVVIDGEDCLDSGLTESLAFRSAIRGGATHVLALQTRVEGGKPEPLSANKARLMRQVLGVPAEAIELVRNRPALYASEMDELKELCSNSPGDSPQVYAIAPRPGDPTVGRLGRNPTELNAGARVGIRAVFRGFGIREPRLYEVTRPYWRPPLGDGAEDVAK